MEGWKEAWYSAGGVEDIPDYELEEQEEDTEGNTIVSGSNVGKKGNGVKVKKGKKSPWISKAQNEAIIWRIFESAKVKLSDGTKAPMFSRGPLYPNGMWPVNCHLCGEHGLADSYRLEAHISKKHTYDKLRFPVNATKYKEGLRQYYSGGRPWLNNLIRIYPGEKITKITPALHNRILHVQGQAFLPRPLNGLYRIYSEKEPLHEYNKKAPLIGLSYCFKMKYFNSFIYYCALCERTKKMAIKHMNEGDHRIKYAEKHFPRLILRIMRFLSDMHDEKAVENIVHEVIRKVYRSIEEKRGFCKIHMIMEDNDRVRLCEKFSKKIQHYGDNHVLKSDEELKEMIETCRNCALTTDSQKVPKFEDNENNWDRYRRLLGAALDDIDETYALYEKIPEKHPSYEDEWKKFWNRRVREIEKDGLNTDDYDFKIEWIPYWKEIMQKYYTTSISTTKLRIKKSLRLPLDKRSPSPIRKQRSVRRKRSPSPERPSRRRRTRSRSPAYRARREESPPAIAKSSKAPGVISVLRLVTALEDILGSLGPKALEYLSKSLLYEKDNGKSANQLLLKEEYYIFFVTAKEKLKGQMIAGLIEKSKYKAVSHVVEQMETLIEMFDNFCKSTGRTITSESQTDLPQTSKQEKSRFNDDDQYEHISQDNYNRNRQQDFDKTCDGDYHYDQYQKGDGQMNQYRRSGGYNNQYGETQNQYDTASSNQYNDDASKPNEYGKKRSMSSYSNQESSSNQYSRSGQGGVWQSGTNKTFRNKANNTLESGVRNYGNTGNQRNRGSQNFRSDRDGSLSTTYDNRGGNYNSNPDSNRDGNYNSNLGKRSGINYDSNLGNRDGNYNSSLQGDTGYSQGNYKRDSYNDLHQSYRSEDNYNLAYSSGNSGFEGNTQGRNMAPPGVLVNKPLDNYGGYNRSSMNARDYSGGNQYN